ncbi:hypothetical protein RCC89_17800 [Cytophagaceae bacterium ABcell3]|nr:hypothetical protein RCC89_17800 [Cytophagaceae bacterium ABcell3]
MSDLLRGLIKQASTFKDNRIEIMRNFGALLRLDLDNDWHFMTGFSNGGLGYSFIVSTIPENNSSGTYQRSYSTFTPHFRFPLMVSKRIATVSKSICDFHLRITSGISIDFRAPGYKEPPPIDSADDFFEDTLEINLQTQVQNRSGGFFYSKFRPVHNKDCKAFYQYQTFLFTGTDIASIYRFKLSD